MSEILIKKADYSQAEEIGSFIFELERELWPGSKERINQKDFIETAERLLNSDTFWIFTAIRGSSILGAMTISEKRAIYSNGSFGEIMELYILPEHRSEGIGTRLMKEAKLFGISRDWPIIEVGAPSQPEWSRTLEFYKRCGFTEIGPRLEFTLFDKV